MLGGKTGETGVPYESGGLTTGPVEAPLLVAGRAAEPAELSGVRTGDTGLPYES